MHFEHLKEQAKLRHRAMLAQQNRMLLTYAQIIAQSPRSLWKVEASGTHAAWLPARRCGSLLDAVAWVTGDAELASSSQFSQSEEIVGEPGAAAASPLAIWLRPVRTQDPQR